WPRGERQAVPDAGSGVGGAEFRQPALGFLHSALVGLVRDDSLVQVDGLGALAEVTVVESGGPQTGVVLRGGVPLDAALEVDGGPAVLVIEDLALVQVAELVRGVADLVAGRVLVKELFELQGGADL